MCQLQQHYESMHFATYCSRGFRMTCTVNSVIFPNSIKPIGHHNGHGLCSLWRIAGLYQRSPRHFVWQPSAQVTQTLRLSYCSHVIAADQYWHLHRSDCRNTLTYTHAFSTLPICDTSLGSLTLPVHEVGDFVELILLHTLDLYM